MEREGEKPGVGGGRGDEREGSEGKSSGSNSSRKCSFRSSCNCRGPHKQRRTTPPLNLEAMQASSPPLLLLPPPLSPLSLSSLSSSSLSHTKHTRSSSEKRRVGVGLCRNG